MPLTTYVPSYLTTTVVDQTQKALTEKATTEIANIPTQGSTIFTAKNIAIAGITVGGLYLIGKLTAKVALYGLAFGLGYLLAKRN